MTRGGGSFEGGNTGWLVVMHQKLMRSDKEVDPDSQPCCGLDGTLVYPMPICGSIIERSSSILDWIR